MCAHRDGEPKQRTRSAYVLEVAPRLFIFSRCTVRLIVGTSAAAAVRRRMSMASHMTQWCKRILSSFLRSVLLLFIILVSLWAASVEISSAFFGATQARDFVFLKRELPPLIRGSRPENTRRGRGYLVIVGDLLTHRDVLLGVNHNTRRVAHLDDTRKAVRLST